MQRDSHDKRIARDDEIIEKVVNEDFYILTNDEYPTEPRTYRNYYTKLMENWVFQN